MIAYASHELKPHKANYPTHDLELGALVFTFNIRRHYLYRVHCTIYMDYKSLRYLNMRQKRWLDMVKDYDFKILYHSGKANVVANTLLRRVMSTPNGGLCMSMMIKSPYLELVR